MGDIDKDGMGREARNTVGAQPPITGENRVQAAMRRYLSAVAFRSQDGDTDETEKRDDPRPRT
ncbi:MAG TPA: hypothetical protein VES02_00025 [Dermatophilaceae bacterium]|nr:hypothetical protein [Dermatophilaceae bacterium]